MLIQNKTGFSVKNTFFLAFRCLKCYNDYMNRIVKKTALIIIVCFLGVYFLNILSADDDVCSVCGRKLPSSYFKSGDKVFCSKKCVLASKPACVVCGRRQLKGGFYWNGKYVCSKECLEKARPKCAVCGKTVEGGTGITSQGRYYCSKECFSTTLPSCCMCGKKIEKMMKTQGRIYCEECFATEKCLQCGLPAGDSRLPDGRPFCSECKAKGLTDPARALKEYRGIQELLRKKFQILTDTRIRFHLVDFQKFQKISENNEMNENGLYKQVKTVTSTHIRMFGVDLAKDLNQKTEYEKDIYILSWLDLPDFRMVTAHELMHDWTQENFPEIKDQRIIEGISEYAGYLVCRHYGYDHLIEKMEKNRDETYGDGFRIVQKAAREKGLVGIIQWIESGKFKEDLKNLDKDTKNGKGL